MKVYKRPDPTLATGVLREYRPRISCFHQWGANVEVVTIDGVEFDSVLPGELCEHCGATCKRDPRGRIVEYAAREEIAHDAEIAA